MSSVVSERYATAIFELAVERGEVETLTQALKAVAEAYRQSEELRSALENPLLDEEQRLNVVGEIGRVLKLGELAKNTLRVLLKRRRISALPEIATRLETLADERAGILRASLVSATPLPEGYFRELERLVEGLTKKKLVLERSEDPTLIGGIVMRIGDNTIDGSIRGRLNEIERRLVQE